MAELQGSELSRYLISPERTSFLKYGDELASSRPLQMFSGERIVLRRLLTRKFRLQASVTSEVMITTDNVLNMVPQKSQTSVRFALGILNSNLMSWLYVNTSMVAQKDDFPQVHISALSSLHLPVADKAQHDRLVQLVDDMLKAKQALAAAHNERDTNYYIGRCESLDHQIDKLVYGLYGLTDEEIALVEGRKDE